jgi:GDP-4-dehydro-6-deoxy-D-mannose reductase
LDELALSSSVSSRDSDDHGGMVPDSAGRGQGPRGDLIEFWRARVAVVATICQPARMRVFVTGASGFVGRRLLPVLTAAGHEAIGVDRETDVTDSGAIQRALEAHSPDAVIHLAAMSSVAQSWRQAEACYRLNFNGTRNLIRAIEATRPAARLMLIGSADQYSATSPQGRAITETTALRPRSPYARTKAACELLGTEAADRGLDVVRVRAFNHTGAGQADAFVVSSFARQVAAIRRGQQTPVMRVGNLESVRDFLHVDDVTRAYLALLDPAVPAEVYNVASGRATSIQEVLDRLLALAGVEARIERDPDRWRETDWLVGDASRLRDATGWQPEIPLESILQEIYDDWCAREGSS